MDQVAPTAHSRQGSLEGYSVPEAAKVAGISYQAAHRILYVKRLIPGVPENPGSGYGVRLTAEQVDALCRLADRVRALRNELAALGFGS